MVPLEQIFDSQIINLITKGYPAIAGLTDGEFRKLVEPLKEHLVSIKFADVYGYWHRVMKAINGSPLFG